MGPHVQSLGSLGWRELMQSVVNAFDARNMDSEGGLRHVLPNMLERTEQMRQPANGSGYQPSSSCERSVDLYHRSQRRFLDSLGVAAIHASDL